MTAEIYRCDKVLIGDVFETIKPRRITIGYYWCIAGSNLTAGHLQATLNKLLTYGVLRSTQSPTLRGTGNE